MEPVRLQVIMSYSVTGRIGRFVSAQLLSGTIAEDEAPMEMVSEEVGDRWRVSGLIFFLDPRTPEEDRQDRERLAVTHPEYVQRRLNDQNELDHDRRGLLATFPYSVVAEGNYWEHDYASRWCWQHIGPMNGLCIGAYTHYPACPLVLATEYLERGEYQGKETVKKRYQHPADHEHEGRWAYLWFGKTDYDYGFGEYYFANETDRAQFLTAFPTFTWNASWDKQGEESG